MVDVVGGVFFGALSGALILFVLVVIARATH